MRSATAVVVAALVSLSVSPALAATAPVPRATLVGGGTASLGDVIVIQGTGWPRSSVVNVVLCGNAALDGSADCDLPAAADAGVGPGGNFSMSVRVGRPPSPCPCVVLVTDTASIHEARVPITVVGVPSAPAHYQGGVPNVSDILKAAGVKVVGGGSWSSWFGAASRRTLEFTVENTSDRVIGGPTLGVTFGKGNDPTGLVDAPAISDIAAHSIGSYRIPLNVDTFSVGTYTVKGEISAFGTPLVFRTHTAAHPWGLLVIGLVILQLLLLVIRNRIRHRLHRVRQEADAAEAQDVVIDAAAFAPAAAIELSPSASGPVEPVVELAETMVDDPSSLVAPPAVPSDATAQAAQALLLASQAAEMAARALDLAQQAVQTARAHAEADGVARDPSPGPDLRIVDAREPMVSLGERAMGTDATAAPPAIGWRARRDDPPSL